MADELIDIYNEKNEPLNIKKMKSEAHADGLWHRTVHIWIYNSRKEILLQLRAKDKDLYPDRWDISSAGHVSAGETPVTSALREIKEELGINAKEEDLKFVRIRESKHQFRNLKNAEFEYIYIMKFDGGEKKLKLQEEELQDARFFPVESIIKGLKEMPEKFVPHGKYAEEMIDMIKSLD